MPEQVPWLTNQSLAAAGTSSTTRNLDCKPDKYCYLTSISAYIDGAMAGFDGTAATPNMVKCEIWLLKGNQKLLLDKGWLIYDTQYNRAVVGWCGRIGYMKDDKVFVTVQNSGTGTSLWGCSYSTDSSDTPLQENFVGVRLHDDVTFIYQARRVATQANVGGGPVIIDVSLATGQIARIIGGRALNSGTNTALGYIIDEDNAVTTTIGTTTSGAGSNSQYPSIGSGATATANIASSVDFILPAGAKLSFQQSGAGAQNDTFTVALILELLNDPTIPTWDKSRSTNPADVTLAASTISAANTIQPIVRPRMIA